MDRNRSAALVFAFLAIAALAIAAASVPYRESGQRSPSTDADGDRQPQLPRSDSYLPDLAGMAAVLQLVFVGLLVVAGTVAAAVGYRTLTRSPQPADSTPDAEPSGESAENLEELAAVAGETANRIRQSGAVENEVYRAWLEMTRALSVSNPRSKTPEEFADVAVRAGMAEEDVEELTRLFNAVRYGSKTPESADEQRAVDLLERVHESYRGESA